MQIRQKYETDGRCFAKMADGCSALDDLDEYICGTYQCDFYKPRDCKDWIRLDTKKGLVKLFTPEEVIYGQD